MSDSLRERLQAALGSAYELERELQGGGMSRVFVARDRILGRLVVVKVLPPDLAAGVNRERFEREIQLAAQLQHPHIVPLLSAGEVPEESGRSVPCPFYTMPFIDGESLRAELERRGPLPVRDVVRALQDVLEALAHAHARGVIHRDIKPANILMQGTHALVTDFGVAKALSAALPQTGATSSGMAIGTPAYMAPEQLAADPKADHRVDLYALGLVGYELLSGRSPFSESSPQATMAAQLTRMPARISQVRPDVPRELEAFLDRCLAKAAEKRMSNAAEALAMLERVPISGSESTVRLARVSGPAAKVPRWPWLIGAVTAVGFAGYLFFRPAPSGVEPVEGVVVGVDSGPSITLSTPEPAPKQLTREDSLLIAAAMIQRERTLRAAAPERNVDSIRNAVRRELADSIALANKAAGPQPGTPVRAFMFDSMARRFEMLSDSLRRMPGGSRIVYRRPDGSLDTMLTQRFIEGMRPNLPAPPSGEGALMLAPPAPGMRRVVLFHFSPRNTGTDGGVLVGPLRDSLKAAFTRTGRYEVLPPDAMGAAAQIASSQLRTNRGVRGRAALLPVLHATAILQGAIENRQDGFTIRVEIEDTIPGPSFLMSNTVPRDAPFPALNKFMDQVVRAVDELK